MTMPEDKCLEGEELIKKIQSFDYIRMCFPDLNGMHLSKLVSTRHWKKILSGHCETYSGMITFGPRMEVVDIPCVVKQKHVNSHLKPDYSTLHQCPWAGYQNRDISSHSTKNVSDKCVGAVICNLSWPTGELVQAHPRVVAQRLLQELKEKHGLQLMSAFEPEFWAFKPDTMDASCRSPAAPIEHDLTIAEPVPSTAGTDMCKTSLLAFYESFFMNLDTMMEKAGVDIQDCSNENGSGQLECPLMPEYGIASADHYFILKQAVKEIALRHGIGVSFMTSPYAEGTSCGCHFNHSLWTIGRGDNALYDAQDPDKLSQLARHWIGGLLTHLPAMLAICSPTVNCYRRLHKKLAPDAVNWSINDRFVSIRVKNTDEKRTYVENRLPSSASCPYHVLASTIAAGMDGIERKLEPFEQGQKPIQGRPSPTCPLLPSTLQEALQLLKNDHAFVEKIGPEFVDWYCQVKERGDLFSLGHIDIKKDSKVNLACERYEYLQYV